MMAKTKSKGSTSLGRDSYSQRLGVKIFDGQSVEPGNIIIRQRGTNFVAGDNVKKGKDDTLYALKEGRVKFVITRKNCFDGKKKQVKIVSVAS